MTKATCHCCNTKTETTWCISCAKDTCEKCWPEHVPTCLNESNKTCHYCDKPIHITNIDNDEGIVMQQFTGRLFCDSDCFDAYAKNEGIR